MRLLPKTLVAAAAAVALSVTLTGCSIIDVLLPQQAARDAATQEVTEQGDADVFTLKVGDCFNDTEEDEEILSVPAVPCADPHDNEIFHTFTMPAGDWPGDDAIDAKSEQVCTAEFQKFIGIAYEDSVLDWWHMTPSQGGWEEFDDREILCSAYDPEGQVTGRLAGAAR